MRTRLGALTVRGYRTFRSLADFRPTNLNILIGANGAGKSNLISFFRMLSWMMNSPGELQSFIGQQGGAGKLLHDGPNATREIEAEIRLKTDTGENDYGFRLGFAAGDRLVFLDEKYRYSAGRFPERREWNILRPMGHQEAKLVDRADMEPTARVIRGLLRRCVVFQFHNTSMTARIRGKWLKSDNRYLKEDAGNIAAVVLRIQEESPAYYKRITEYLRAGLPFFADFEIQPSNGSVLLQWRELRCDQIFDVSQASDGMLRFMALVVLLAQPPEHLPDVLILDEPELGLHPYAIEIVAGLLKSASREAQVIVATQSAALLDRFGPEDIVVVERTGRESVLKRLSPEDLREWREEYSMSQLWEKNVFGGRP